MTPTSTIEYLGELRTEAIHALSSNKIITDAPTDNHGKGEAFSPTDLLATSLVSCMLTVMGIVSEKREITMGKVQGSVEKIMASGPRRVSELHVHITFSEYELNEAERKILEDTALNCPVAKSIHPDITVNLKFTYL